jgi:hypothetical protein
MFMRGLHRLEKIDSDWSQSFDEHCRFVDRTDARAYRDSYGRPHDYFELTQTGVLIPGQTMMRHCFNAGVVIQSN